jgi:hypothetical protein
MWLLPSKRQLRLSRRIGITGAIGTGGIEDERTISIPDGEQAEISEYADRISGHWRRCYHRPSHS